MELSVAALAVARTSSRDLPWESRARVILLALAGSVPPMIVWPPDGFDGYYALKAYAVISLGACLVGWWAAAVLRRGGLPCRVGMVGLLGTGLGLWLTISVLLSASPETGVWGFPGRDDGLLVWLSGLLVMASAAVSTEWGQWRTVLAAALGAGFLLSLYGVLQHFGVDASGLAILGQTGRVFSGFRNPILFGGYLTLIFPLLLCGACEERRWTRIMATALSALYFSYTRAAWLATAGGVVVFLTLAWRAGAGRWVRRGIAALCAATVVAAMVALIPVTEIDGVQDHSLQADLSTLSSVSNTRNDGRLAIWEISLHMVADHPLVGVGLDQMGSVFEEYRTTRFDLAEGEVGIADRAHSDPLHLAVVAGIPAAILYCLMVGVVVGRALLRSLRRRDVAQPLWHCGVIAAACAYVAQSLVSITVPGVHTLLFLLLGSLAAWRTRLPQGGGVLPTSRST